MGAGEVGEVDEHEGIEGSVGEHGFERNVVGGEHGQGVLQEASEFGVLRDLAVDDVGDVGVEDFQVLIKSLQSLFKAANL